MLQGIGGLQLGSKLDSRKDASHIDVVDAECPDYGHVVVFMSCPRNGPP